MIVRPAGNGTLLLVTQPDHARLAAAIISAWRTGTVEPASARAAVLFAIEQHDNGWREVDAAPALNAATGRPYDFADTPPGVKQEIWPRGAERLAAESPLAAALVARHGLTLHAHRRGDPTWQGFFARLEQIQAGLLHECGAEAGPDKAAFERAYDLLHLGDLLSLVFCNLWTDPMDAKDYRITLGRDEDLCVSPDPFDGARVCFEVPAHVIADRRYESDAALRVAFRDAPVVKLRGTAAGVGTAAGAAGVRS
jgi:hypothetical protein